MPTRTLKYRRPVLYPAQERAIFAPERYAVIEASIKSGKTTGCLVWLAEEAMRGARGWNYWWVAPVFAQARIAFRRMKRGLPPSVYTANHSEMTLTLANGAVIWFKSGDNPDSLYGEDVYAAVVDEASRCREEAWHAVRSTLTATRGPVRIIGNVKGRKNWAYKLARKAEAMEPDMHFARITAHDAVEAGIFDAAEIEDARRTLPEDVFRQLYLAEPTEDEGNPFGIEAIRACIGPLSAAPAVAWGWDLAKSIDWTVGIGLDRDGDSSSFQRFQSPWEDTMRRIRTATGRTPALVDSTGVGDPVLEALQRTPGGRYQGYKFTSPSKQQLMEGLAVAIQQGDVSYPDGPIAQELESFEYAYSRTGVRYAAPEGSHDDCVVALALAVEKLGPALRQRPSRSRSYSFQSLS